jgi:uncharacterized membrane protein YesL
MVKKKTGLFARLVEGPDRSEDYARKTLPKNRWSLGWDLFSTNLGKLVKINLLMLLFLFPLFLIIAFRGALVESQSLSAFFSQNLGIGYPAVFPDLIVGVAEEIELSVDVLIFIALFVFSFYYSIGLAGGFYVIRNMVWTEGIFVANDFWRGIKQNFKQVCIIAMLFSLVFYLTSLSISLAEQNIAMATSGKWMHYVSMILSYVVLVLAVIMSFHMLSMCVTYDLKFKQLFRNSMLFSIGLFPQSIFFLFLGALPFLFLTMGDFLASIGIILLIFVGLSLILLIWTDFSQWAFDKFINDKVEGAQKNRGIYEKIKESDSASLKKYREQMALAAHSSLNSKPIKPITDDELKLAELPSSFNRNDIIKLNESKQAIIEDHERYVEEHKNDPEFVRSEEEISLEEKERLEREKRIEKAKRELAKRNRNK